MIRFFMLGILLAGCSSITSVGRIDYDGIPPDPIATYRIPHCTSMSDGTLMEGERYVYYLVRANQGLRLIELDLNRFGWAIENTWTDEKGRHFAYYSEGLLGHDFIIPEDPKKPGVVMNYMDFQVIKTESGFRLQGTPFQECELRPLTAPSARAGQAQ